MAIQTLTHFASGERKRSVIQDVEELRVPDPSASSVWQRSVRHGRQEEYIDWSSGRRMRVVPHVVVSLLCRHLLFVELPVFVHGYCRSTIDQCLNMREKRLAAFGDSATYVFPSVCGVVRILTTSDCVGVD